MSLALIIALAATLTQIDSDDPCVKESNPYKIFIYALVTYSLLLVLSSLGLLYHCMPERRCVNLIVYNTCAFSFPFAMIHTALVFQMSVLKLEYCESFESSMKWIWPF